MYLSLNQDNKPKSGRKASPERSLPSKGLFGNGSERQDLRTGAGNRNRRSRFSRIFGYRDSIQDTYLGIGASCPFPFNSDFLGSLPYRYISLLREVYSVLGVIYAISVAYCLLPPYYLEVLGKRLFTISLEYSDASE